MGSKITICGSKLQTYRVLTTKSEKFKKISQIFKQICQKSAYFSKFSGNERSARIFLPGRQLPVTCKLLKNLVHAQIGMPGGTPGGNHQVAQLFMTYHEVELEQEGL